MEIPNKTVSPDWNLSEDENLFKSIYKHSPLGLAFSGKKGKILRVNQKFCNLLGYKEEELIGKSFGDLTPDHFNPMEKEIPDIRKIINAKGE